jgi:biopolymer transport protein ExbB/TolQ
MGNPIWQIISDSGAVGNAILVILFIASIITWTVIIHKYFLFRQVNRSSEMFMNRFRRAQNKIFSLPSPAATAEIQPFYNVYQAGCRRLSARASGPPDRDDPPPEESEKLKAALVRTAEEQISYLSKNLVTLATAGSTGPLLGILGTVWGVLQAFCSMGQFGSASISAVAPGISVALITTVAGLVVAIPAVVSYNYFTHSLERFTARLDNFISDFLEAAEDHPDLS